MSPAYQCDSKIICHCLGVTEDELQSALGERAIRSVQEIVQETGAGNGCTACRRAIQEFLNGKRT
jgi:bacterioferritin-associated ferredoxin